MAVKRASKRKGKIDYSKKHACLFCEKLDLKISRHLCSSMHKNEKVIAQLPPPKKGNNKPREHILDALRNEGDFLYNVNILQNGDKEGTGLIVAKRPQPGVHFVTDYLPCKYCLKFFIKSELWRHGKRCPFMPEPLIELQNSLTDDGDGRESRRFVKDSMYLLSGAGVSLRKPTKNEKLDFYYYVLDSIQDDKIGKKLKRDADIVQFGKNEYERLGKRRANEVRYRMRLLERIKQTILDLSPDNSQTTATAMVTLLSPEKFDLFVQAVRMLVGVSQERSLNGVIMFQKPQLARKTGQIIRKFSDLCEGRAVVEKNRERRQDIADFMFLYTKNWSSKIGSIAHQTSVENCFNKKEMLPLTKDLLKVQAYLDKQITEQSELLNAEPNKKNWRIFAFLLLSKLTMFNFRRGNECAAMQVTKFQQRDDWKSGNHEIYESLSSFEQELAKK